MSKADNVFLKLGKEGGGSKLYLFFYCANLIFYMTLGGLVRGVAVYPVYPPVYTSPLPRLETCIHLYTFCAVYPLYTPNLIWWGCRAHLYTPVYPKTCILAVYLLYTCCIPPVYLMEGDVSCIPCIPPLCCATLPEGSQC